MAKGKDTAKFKWALDGSYTVKFAQDAFGEGSSAVAETLREITGLDEPKVMLVADANVVQRTEGLGTRIGRYVRANGIKLAGAPVVIGGGEKIKADGMQSAHKVMSAALDARVGASDVMLVIGGGSIIDVAGYAAAQVRGGLKTVRMPTTPASMIDGAFADSAGVDATGVKDAFRVPSHPSAVVIDTTFANTVLDGVWRAGIGEAVRYAAVRDSALMKRVAKDIELLKDRDVEAMADIVRACAESRAKKGATGFGLWSAGRMEAMSAYRLPHGYAVPMGICIDCAYAFEKGLLKQEEQDLICGALTECGALEGLGHSRHLLSQTENILRGLDAWRLATGSSTIDVPAGVGKCSAEEPDRELMAKVVKAFHDESAQG